MDDLFGMLYGDLSPSKKLLTAVTNNMVDSICSLAAEGMNMDEVLHHHNGNRALHVACVQGHKACVQAVLSHGANADALNNFGFTALSLALRRGNAGCAQVLMTHGTMLTEPNNIWTSQNMDESHTWLAYSVDCLKTLINATPDLSWFTSAQCKQLFTCSLGKDLLKMYLLCGNRLAGEKLKDVMGNAEKEFVNWVKAFQRCQSLQHYARSEIRRHLRPNVFYGSRNLPIPVKIQEYLLITDLDNPCV